MKKIIIGICVSVFLFTGCEKKLENPSKVCDLGFGHKTYVTDHYSDNMHYKIFNSNEGGVFVINVTKDSLEIEKLNADKLNKEF